MKSRVLRILTEITAMMTLLAPLAMPAQPAAQEQHQKAKHVQHYTITDLGTLGGTYSYAYGINNAGQVAGGSATPTQSGGVFQTAFLWDGGHMINLGTLGGPSSEADAPNARGEVPVLSETSTPDPNGEDFCGFGTHLQCLGAIWKNGVLTALPTLPGGHNAQAYGINNRGQLVGFAENGYRETSGYCATPFQVLRFEAVIWGPHGEIQELHPLAGDTVAFAFGINDKGQAVGASGLCSNTSLPPNGPPGAPHAVLWEKDGSVTDLGILPGGVGANVATSINNRGEVVGNVQLSDGTFHPFLWTRQTGMHALGAFPGAVATIAPCCDVLNNKGEVAGFSCDAVGNCRALVWQDEVPVDLNTLIPEGSPWYLQGASSINDAGEIAGFGATGTGEIHAFLATPSHRFSSFK